MVVKLNLYSAAVLAAALAIASPLMSAEIDGIRFNDRYEVNGSRLDLRGLAVLNYMLVIRAYAGALYLPPDVAPGQALTDRPRILELHYFHAISAEDFRESTAEMIRRNTTAREFSNISRQVSAMNALYRSVRPGDRYRAEYDPARGTTLYLGGRALGTVEGAAFSRAFFSIWIGSNPIDRAFRDRLLGKR